MQVCGIIEEIQKISVEQQTLLIRLFLPNKEVVPTKRDCIVIQSLGPNLNVIFDLGLLFDQIRHAVILK